MRFLWLALLLAAAFSAPAMPHATRDLRPSPSSMKSLSGLYNPHEEAPMYRAEVASDVTLEAHLAVHHEHHRHNTHEHRDRSNADTCDCGKSRCRCSEALWDMALDRVDESAMEDGMMDQGYRQHV